MTRPSKREEKKQAQGMDFLLGLLGETGYTVDEGEIKKAFEEVHISASTTKTLQAEGVLLHLQNANRTMEHKYCKRCQEVFSTRYRSVAYCSDLCRKKAMEEFGILWNPRTDHYQNMDAERPIVIGAQAHAVVLQAAQRFLEDQNILVQEETKPQEEEAPQDSLEQLAPEFLVPEFLRQEISKQEDQADEKLSTDLHTIPDSGLPRSDFSSLLGLESPFHP